MSVKYGPDTALSDLRQYVNQYELQLNPDVENVFYRAEKLGQEYNEPLSPWTFLIAAIESIKPLRSAMIRCGGDPNKGIGDALERLGDEFGDPYDPEGYPYSTEKSRGSTTRTILIDLAISIAKRNRQTEITIYDFLEALFESFEQEFPVSNNGNWTDEALHTPFNTLAHIVGGYKSSLWVRLDDLRRELGLFNGSSPAETAPPEVRTAVLELLEEYPNYDRNCFVIMPFRNTTVHSEIFDVIRDTLNKSGFNALRADTKSFSDDLFLNILSYLHGCKFGIAVFERVLSEDFNPNVSLEVGYLLGLGKPVLLLKDQTLPRLPSDLVGRLYTEFNTLQIKSTLPIGINNWLLNKRLIRDNTQIIKA